MNAFLSIDVGTSSTKLSLFGEHGEFIASRSASYPVEYPHPEWAEQSPEEWWRAVCQVAPEIVLALGKHRLGGISVSGQTPLCAPVDSTGAPLRKAILWLDRRATGQAEWLRAQVGEDRCRRVSSNRVDSYFGGAKWLWYQQEEPARFARTWKILQASSYVIMKLTGEGGRPGRTVIDPAQAGLCSPCFNSTTAEWDEAICAEIGIPLDLLPEVHRPEEIVGTVSKAAARETGLPEGTPLVCGGGDFACACLGAGVSGQGPLRGALMLGTAGNLLFPGMKSSGPDNLPDARLLHTLHLTGVPLPFGGVMAGGNLSWFAGLLESSDPDAGALFSRLDREAAEIPPGSEGLVFLPYLMGERTPIWDPGARGAFVGLSSRHRRAHLYRAVLEGVAFAFRQITEIVEGDESRGSLQSITAIDGGARSPLWRQIFADILHRPIEQGSERSGTALGSAFLAALGTGAVPSYDAIADWVEIASVNQPDPASARRYDEIYPVYKGLYPKLKSDFTVLGRI